MTQCLFKITWAGRCKDNAIDESGYCIKHKDLLCASCGQKATHDCGATSGGLICGAPLCNDCEHTLCDNGCNGGGKLPDGYKTHCKKDAQVYRSWIEQEYIAKHGEEAFLALVKKHKG